LALHVLEPVRLGKFDLRENQWAFAGAGQSGSGDGNLVEPDLTLSQGTAKPHSGFLPVQLDGFVHWMNLSPSPSYWNFFWRLFISRDANTGDGQDFTGLATAVQLRHSRRVGLQALK
jgi:hypothetical protein